jgi:hypothetical protein
MHSTPNEVREGIFQICGEIPSWGTSSATASAIVTQVNAKKFPLLVDKIAARGSIVGWGTMLQAGRSPVLVLDGVDFSIHLILPAALRPWGRLSL